MNTPYASTKVLHETHRMLKIEAAKRGTTMIELQEHLIRLGLIAEVEKQPRLAEPQVEYDANDL